VDWIRTQSVRPLMMAAAGLVAAGAFCLQRVVGDADYIALEYDKLGTFYIGRGEYEKAVQEFRRAVAFMPWSWYSRLNLAMALNQTGKNQEAEPILLRMRVENRGDNFQIATEFGIIRLRQRRLAEAIAIFREAVGLEPTYGKAWRFLTEALRQKGDMRALLAACEAWTRALPQDAEGRARLATVRAYLHQ